MSHIGHYIRKCSTCQSVVSQCRCPNFNGFKEVRWQSSCDKCHGVKPASDNEPKSEPDPGAKMPLYDSRPDTYAHIALVRRYVHEVIHDLFHREEVHDASKLEDPELSAFNEATPLLKDQAYGTEEYRATLRKMKPALDHHYAHNSHHPEHYPDGIQGMSLVDLVEMLCDWKAAGERHENNPGLEHSIEINQARFGYSDELKKILLNTARLLA